MATIKIKIASSPFPILTTRQVKEATGRSESQISQTVNRIGKGGVSQLDQCYPFPHSNKPEHTETGPKLIVDNDKYQKFLAFCKRNKLG